MAGADLDFTAFVAARADHLYRQAWLLTGSTASAEDLVQTALTRAYAAWPRVCRADDPVAYVHGVLLKAFLSDRRRRWSGEVPVADPGTHLAEASDPIGAHTDRLTLVTALRGLAPIDRAVVVLRYWEDRSVRDTAAALGLTESSVKNRSLRALRSLGEVLRERADPPLDSPEDQSQFQPQSQPQSQPMSTGRTTR